MPLQSGSDRILKAMNRNYRRKRYLAIIEALRARVPDMAITTDIIVGFPGETEEDFLATMEVLEAVRFVNSYSFMFSPRPGTKAEQLPDMPEEIKKDRLMRFQSRQLEITAEELRRWIGLEVEVLIEGPSTTDPTLMQGRTSQNIMFNFTRASTEIAPGKLVRCRVAAASRFTLRGDLLTPAILGNDVGSEPCRI